MNTIKKIFFGCLIAASIFSCNDDDQNVRLGDITLQFDNRMSTSEDLVLNSSTFMTSSSEMISVSELKYIISNITLTQDNGTVFQYPQEDSYFVINEENTASLSLQLENIPNGTYTGFSFGFGVDQSRYPLDGGGVLNFIPTAEEAGMLWNWAAGYKFLKFEGSFTPTGSTESDFVIHVGSHGTTLDNYKTINLAFDTPLEVSASSNPTIQIQALVDKIFDGANTIRLSDGSDIQIDPVNAPKIATNVTEMFSLQ